MNATSESVSRYYTEMMPGYLRYGRGALGLHTPLWGEGVRTLEEAILHSNQLIADRLAPSEGDRILEAGCGLGGLTFFLAEGYGTMGRGISVCPDQVQWANEEARNRGLSYRVRFELRDFNRDDTSPPPFDGIVAQDAFCYADDLAGYFSRVHRWLAPGGKWIVIDAFAAHGSDPEFERLMPLISDGWRVPAFRAVEDVGRVIRAAGGFEALEVVDLTGLVTRSALAFITEAASHAIAGHPDHRDDSETETYRRHMLACAAFGQGILGGSIRYAMISTRKT